MRFLTSQYGPHLIYSGIFIDSAILELSKRFSDFFIKTMKGESSKHMQALGTER
jgi:hypothetical protein